MIASLACLLLAAQASAIQDGPEARLAAYLQTDPRHLKPAALEDLEAVLQAEEIVYLDGGSASAAARLGALFLDPAFRSLEGHEAAECCRYYLASALAREGAYGRARHLLMEILERPASPMRAAAFRRLIDVALGSEQLEPTLQAIGSAAFQPDPDERDEIAYLQGKDHMLRGRADPALESFARVRRQSRLFAAAVYLSGVIALERGQVEAAEGSFCRLVRQPGGARATYLVSEQADRVLEQAWLALARLRYDRGDFGRAIATYRKVPKRGAAGVAARYEGAWALYRSGALSEAVSALSDSLSRMPAFPDRPGAELLLAYSLLGECRFDEALARLETIGKSLAGAGAAIREPPEEQPLPRRIAAWVPPRAAERRLEDLRDSIESALWRRLRLGGLLSELDGQAAPARRLASSLEDDRSHARALLARLAELKADLPPDADSAALAEISALERSARAVAERTGQALSTLAAAGLPKAQSAGLPQAVFEAERGALAALGRRLVAERRQAEELLSKAQGLWYDRARKQIAAWERQVELGRLDAVMGRKQTLEIEVQNLALGRYPLSLIRELAEAGLLDETTEYWPYDAERWPDEYE